MSLFQSRYKCVSKCKSVKVELSVRRQPIVLHWEGHNLSIWSAIEVNEHLMESLSFQIDLVPPQYHIVKISKLSRHSAAISVGCYGVVAGLLFTLGTQAQVGASPKKMENT
jgi:hypothetical protein